MPDKTYRVLIEENSPKFKPDSRSSTPTGWYLDNWSGIAQVEGSAKLVADALRSIADQLDPKKPTLRSALADKAGGEDGPTQQDSM